MTDGWITNALAETGARSGASIIKRLTATAVNRSCLQVVAITSSSVRLPSARGNELPHVHVEVGAVDVALCIDGDTFGERRSGPVRIGTWIGNEVLHRAVARAADADAAADAGVEAVAAWRERIASRVGAAVA